MEYECFQEPEKLKNLQVELISPREDDPSEYAVVEDKNGKRYSLTLAGAANLLGYVPEGDYARGCIESARAAWQALGEKLHLSAEEAARKAVDLAMEKLSAVVSGLIQEYELDKNFVTFVGRRRKRSGDRQCAGGKMQVKCKIAKNAPYISTIGVALAMVREQLERNMPIPRTRISRKSARRSLSGSCVPGK